MPDIITKFRLKELIVILIISFTVFFIYHQTFRFPFINFDDPVYVSDNEAVRQGITYEGITWAFGIHPDICMYYQPVAWLSHMLDCELHGLNPGRHHLMSVLFHLLNSTLLFLLLRSITGSLPKSAFAALLFACHPVNVDAVAWIAERKTVLSGFFWILGTWLYVGYTKKPNFIRYACTATVFALGLLTKPVMITFPCTLILLDIWPLKRIDKNIGNNFHQFLKILAEKIPLFVITAMWFITPFLSKTLLKNETLPDVVPYSLRFANLFVSYTKYVWKFIFPIHLSILYPYPSKIPLVYSIPAFLFLLSMTAFFIYKRSEKPHLIVFWLWFAGTMFPTSGLIIGTLWPEMADRWAYIPYIGLCVMVSWSLMDDAFMDRWASTIKTSTACIILIIFTVAANKQTRYWQNSISIFSKALTEIPYHYLPHQNIATEYMKESRHDKARDHLTIILEHESGNESALFNMGLSFLETSEFDTALVYLKKAIDKDPGDTRAYIAAAHAMDAQHNTSEALHLLDQALVKARKPSDIQFAMARLESRTGSREKAEQRILGLISTGITSENVLLLYADLLLYRNDIKNAFTFYQSITSKNPANRYGFNGMGICSVKTGNVDAGIKYLEMALAIDPTDREIESNLRNARTNLRFFEK